MSTSPPSTEGLTLPHSVEAEREILAAALVDSSTMDTVVEAGVTAEDFYLERHSLVFESMGKIHERQGTIDEITLREKMKDLGTWDKAGGSRTLGDLLDRAGTTSHLPHYCGIVREKAMTRRMIEAARSIEVDGLRRTEDVADYLDEAERRVFAVLESRSNTSMRPISHVVKDAFEQISAAYDSEDHLTGLGTGFKDLDALTQGLHPGDLVIIAGRPGMGKTSFVLNLAANCALKHEAAVAVFSLEMPADQLATRLLASEARIGLKRLRSGMLAEDDWPKLTNAADRLTTARLFIDDSPGINPSSIRAKCRRLARKGGLDLVIVDYLQLMTSGQFRRESSREQEISYISRTLKGLAKDLGIPVIALSQLNRSVESRTDKRPQMSDLRESGAIEQDADIIGFIYREEFYKRDMDESQRGLAELIISKHRNGPTGTVRLKFWHSWTRFDSLSHDDR